MEEDEDSQNQGQRVPKITHHFESLAEKVKDLEEPHHSTKGIRFPRQIEAEGGISYPEQEKNSTMYRETQAKKEEKSPSLEVIAKYRTEAIKGTEERYSKAKGGSTLTSAGKTALDYAAQKAVQAKNVVVSAGETTVHYVGEKAVVVKDVAGHKAAQAKDAAVVIGFRATHYSLEKVVQVTEATADAGRRVAEPAEVKAKEAEEEAQNKEAKRSSQLKQGMGEFNEDTGEKWQDASDIKENLDMELGPIEDNVKEGQENEENQGGGLSGAVGETLDEIVKSTKDLLVGEPKKE